MSKAIKERINKYIEHKVNILVERVYLAILDKIFDAENYDEFDIDDDNNIFITYSLKRDESIISDAHTIIENQIKKKYRKNLEEKLEEEGYFVEYDDSDLQLYFFHPFKIELNDSDESNNSKEQNLLIYKKQPVPVATVLTEESNLFDFGDD